MAKDIIKNDIEEFKEFKEFKQLKNIEIEKKIRK